MKVIERGSDRRAQVNIYVDGQVAALKEYDQYIDPRDNAICCYVVIDEGHKPRVGGRFTGTTLAVAYDTIVDGVLRKANSYVAKAVSLQTNRKIDTEKFLCKNGKEIIDTEMTATPLLNVVMTQGDEPETIGTIEHRLYITRQLGVSHEVSNVRKYYEIEGGVEEDHRGSTEQKASYMKVPPTLKMSLEENIVPLEGTQPNLHKRRADAKRPGPEPWAIFRFHYRSEDDMEDRDMIITFDPKDPGLADPHTLALEPLPPLVLGARPASKNDGYASSRSESPMPSTTPAKSAQSENKTLAPSEQATAAPKQALANGDTDNSISTSDPGSGGEKVTEKIAAAPSVPVADMIAKVSSLPGTGTKLANVHPDKSVAVAKETVTKPSPSPLDTAKKPPQSNTPAKKQVAKPASISTSTVNGQKKPGTPTPAVVPAKRTSSTTNGIAPPEPKRTMPTPTPTLPIAQPVVLRSSTPKTLSIERQLADQRKNLEDMRKRRAETAKKQADIDAQMGPYKQRMAEELDRLKREMMEEESAYTEEAEHYSASVEVLKEFKKADDGN
ncbi:uncharacterized protein J4E87_005409 [Alternaria ethzedia]|uniref:uncharacterized protein n=1 Tax=Alternaria ethzedia TaxID=181014 RepID=UPI0020C260EF|nr:uncharacterized protein J4E87_005409 [Alternaria ethzedia]KAI4624928.1 hypothetical protein J4E87_005409 [Alternaria ethzedia]